jgi:ribonuclease P protein component
LIQARGRRVNTAHFVLVVWASDRELGGARLGITASRKIGGAVVRNRAKRVIREAFRRASDLWAPDIDVVVIVRRALEDMKVSDVVEEWSRARSALQRRTDDARSDLRARTPPRAAT